MAAWRRERDRLFEDVADVVSWGRFPGKHAREPAVEVADTPGTVVVTALIPGVHKKDLHVDMTNETLTLRGFKKDTKKAHYSQ